MVEGVKCLCKAKLAIISDKESFSCKGGSQSDEFKVWILFLEFRRVLGPVGAVKALHLFAPKYFPLWYRSIVKKAYDVSLDAAEYLAMMRVVKFELKDIREIPEI